MNTDMISVIALHRMDVRITPGYEFHCSCGEPITDHPAHLAEKLAKAGYGNVQEAKAEALTDAADWLVNGEAAGIIAYDGPSNRGEVTASYDAALEDPEAWLRERAEATLAVDPTDLYREAQDGLAEAWAEGRAASPDTLNPYEDWPSTNGATD
ncbi:hypothetical protein ABIB35_001517 [Arthrobacter sp. UYP6]|uniref:hypothetical protein n=1 Tax=Arthrobacter sp. UYP6 TaxID=1756378 RepID=UPI003390ACC7